MHVSIHGSFTFILNSINRFSMSPDKWLKILFDFNKEISMLILKILPMEMNESLLVCCPLLPVCTCPPPAAPNSWAPSCHPYSFLWLHIHKIWHPLKSLRSGSLAKTNRSYLGPLIPAHLHSFCAKGQRMSEMVAASQAQHGTALIYQCSVFLSLNMPVFIVLKL